MPNNRTVRTTCSLCNADCGLIVKLENGKIVEVQGDKKNLISEGYICSKGKAIPEIVHAPDRIRYPMLKVGEEKWERITWDKAFELVVQQLEGIKSTYGPEAVTGSARPIGSSGWN